ncbi:Site-specific DNA recombinase [Colwellia chukchiensis]|uniref:Site-specific DNA recombinase n=1 Tax=Colwellia chukchiensis TaxID=641665 RepID=A0A1H7GWD0_9GAMM|nr:recombinase family protein [Colwellia chukchiensis]SEK40195.1 Site-specific DNA recombinase [Colwellia chukchiensis]
MKRKAYLYQRVSSKRQMGNSSLYRQSEAQEAWLAAHPEVQVERVLVDDGYSGYKGKNLTDGELGAFVSDIKTGKIEKGSILLLEQFSRLTRLSISKTKMLLQDIWEGGVTIVTISDNQEYPPESADDIGKWMRLLVEIESAHKDSAWRSDKAKASHKRRKIEALKEKTAPRIRKPFWLDDKGELNDYATAVKDMFTMYLKGLGQVSILNSLRVQYPKYEPIQNMTPTTVIRIITSERCLGIIFGAKLYTEVVTEDIFYKAQQIHSERLYKNVRPDRRWPLHGLVKCGHCQKGNSIQQTGEALPLLRCSNKRRKGAELSGCDSRATFPYIIADYFFKNHVEMELLAELSESKRNESDEKELSKNAHLIRQKKDKLDELQDFYQTAREKGTESRTILNMIMEVDSDLAALESRQKALNSRLNSNGDFFISREVLQSRDEDFDQYNLNLHLLGFRMVIYENTISYGKLKLEYVKYDRSQKVYSCKLNGETAILIPSEGVTPEQFLMPKPLKSDGNDIQSFLYDALDEYNEIPDDNSANLMMQLLSKNLMRYKKSNEDD